MRRTATSLFARSAALLSGAAPYPYAPLTTLAEDEQMLVENIREFAQKEIKPITLKMDKEGQMCPQLIEKMFANGIMGIETPTELGGSGLTFFHSLLAIEELARVDPAVSVVVDVHSTLVNNSFYRYASDDLKKQFLPTLATESIGSFCLTEPGSGSDAFALKTRAEKKGTDYVINGSKIFITSGKESNIFLVMANVDPSKGYKGITCFVLDKRIDKGVNCVRLEKKLGLCASSTAEMHFDNVVVPESRILGNIGQGYKIAIELLNEGRIGIGAQMVGIAQGAMDAAMPYVFERKQFNTVIGDFQGMQFQYAQANLDIQAARLLCYNAGRKKMAGIPFVEDAAMAKLFASQVAERVASKAIEWCGGVGFSRDFGVERFYRDAKIGAIYEGTSNIQLKTLAKFVKDQYVKK